MNRQVCAKFLFRRLLRESEFLWLLWYLVEFWKYLAKDVLTGQFTSAFSYYFLRALFQIYLGSVSLKCSFIVKSKIDLREAMTIFNSKGVAGLFEIQQNTFFHFVIHLFSCWFDSYSRYCVSHPSPNFNPKFIKLLAFVSILKNLC